MTIERIGSTERMSKIVKHNNTVYLCGQTAADEAWVADKPKPARACVEAHMARPCVLVELSVTAAQ
jgi:enamine deaminase RidA (YjgF/YER057c/UK114 family)